MRLHRPSALRKGAIIIVAVLALARCARKRLPNAYEIPASYRGWVRIRFGVPGCPLLIERDGHYPIKVDSTGDACTASRLPSGEAADEYYFTNGSRKRINLTGWGGGGLIWGQRLSYLQNGKVNEQFFVGTEVEFNAATASGVKIPD